MTSANPHMAAADRRAARDTWVWRVTKVLAVLMLFMAMAILGSVDG